MSGPLRSCALNYACSQLAELASPPHLPLDCTRLEPLVSLSERNGGIVVALWCRRGAVVVGADIHATRHDDGGCDEDRTEIDRGGARPPPHADAETKRERKRTKCSCDMRSLWAPMQCVRDSAGVSSRLANRAASLNLLFSCSLQRR